MIALGVDGVQFYPADYAEFLTDRRVAEACKCSIQEVWRMPHGKYLRIQSFLDAETLAPSYHQRTGEKIH